MTVRMVIGPLVSGATYRRGVHLLLGGVIVLPYILLGAVFVQMLTSAQTPRAATLILLVVAAVIATVPAFLRGTRALEIAAARALLDVDLPDPAAIAHPGRIDPETRLRSALWFALHLIIGGAVGLTLISALPMALVFLLQWVGIGEEAMAGVRIGPLDGGDTVWLTVLGLVMLLAVGYAVAGLGALARMMAPVLLGPSATERISALEARAGQLAERNRLARELHDSIGHALTVATVQAGAARELLDADPEFARRALQAIEETGRAAMDDLDHVLGLLRDQEADRRAPQRTLADLARLVADVRAAGLPVAVEETGALDTLPAVVSREGYRIVQEGLTNAVRHASGQPVTLRIGVLDGTVDIELVNRVTGTAVPRHGRGLAGMRERVALLGGRMTAGRDGDGWRVAVRLPAGRGTRS